MALDEDFALLLDFAELLEAMLLLDFTELLLEATLDDERTLLLDRSPTGAEDDERTLLLDRFPDKPGMTEEEESSSPGRTKLLSSSQAATKNARPNPSKKRFVQKILLRYVVYLANFPSSLHPVFVIFPAKRIEHDD